MQTHLGLTIQISSGAPENFLSHTRHRLRGERHIGPRDTRQESPGIIHQFAYDLSLLAHGSQEIVGKLFKLEEKLQNTEAITTYCLTLFCQNQLGTSSWYIQFLRQHHIEISWIKKLRY